MKKILLLFVALLCATSLTFAQDPPFYSTPGGTSSNSFPLNTTTSNKVQWIYGPGEFSSMGGGTGTAAYQGLIDTLWYRVTTPTANMTAGFEISFGQNVGTQTTWTSGTYVTGLTSVQGPGPLNFTTLPTRTTTQTGTWVGFPLATPYLYNPLLSLVIEVRQSGYSPGTTTPQFTANGSRRIWGGYTATTGSFGTGQANMGMSLSSPLNCATPTMGSATFIGQDSVTLAWTENNSPAATTWQIEYGPSGFTPTGTPQITTTSNPLGIGGLTQNTSYDFYVRTYCGPGDSSYYHPILNVLTLATCPWPTALTATNVTSTSADLGWTENGTATTWDIEIGLSGFTPTGNPAIPGITINPFSLAGLPGNTCFDYYVRAACGGTNGNSQWTGPFTFCTTIPPLSCPGTSNASVIFTENFDNTFTGATYLPQASLPGWTKNGTSTGNPRWALESNNTGSGSTGPNYGAPNGSNNGYVYLEVSCVSGGTDTLISPPIDLTAITGAAEVKWFNHMYGPNSGKLEVFVDNGSSQTMIYSDSGQTHTGSDPALDPWDSVVVSLNAFVGQTINLRFVGTAANPGGCSGDRGIDDIEIQGCVSCAIPTALAVSNATATTADLSWTPGGSETVWDVHVQPAGNPAPTQTTVPTDPGVTTNNPYGLTGLTPFQLNDVYVRADCGADSSAWAGPIQVLACAPLAGTYTIDPSIPTSGTNFHTLTQVAIALDCGISAPVVFDMAPGTTFNEQVVFDEVVGASSVNTITFNGNGDTVTYAATVSAERHTIRMDAADYFRWNDVVVQSTGTTGFAMHLFNASNGGCDNNIFKNCTFMVPLTSTSSVFCPMPWSGSLTSPTTSQTAGNGADSNIVDSCNIIGGYYGMTMYAPTSAPYAVGNQVLNSTFEDFYFYGHYQLYQQDLIFSKNDLSRPTRPVLSSCYPVYASGNPTNRCLYEKNHIHTNRGSSPSSSGTFYGFYLFADASSAANENIIENNLIEDVQGGGTQYGIYSSTAQYLNVRHNTIVLDDQLGVGGITRGIVQFGTTALGQKCQNNNVYINRSSSNTHYGLYLQSGTITESNNNVYLDPAMGGTNYYGYNGSANQVDLAAWQASTPSVGVGNTDVDPIFVNPAADDYEPGNSAMDDIGAALGVVDDHIDAPRSATTPDAGAFEFTVSCPQPDTLMATNVTSSSADLTWVEMGSATQWEVEWVVQGNPPTGMGTITTTQPVSASGLISGTAYDWYVRAICGPMDSSNWAQGVFVTPTGCDSVTAVSLSGVTANSVTVAWTENNTPAATLWNVEIVLQGTTPTGNGVLTTSNPYTDTTLLSNTCYDVYIQTACDTSASSFSFVNGPYSFCTPCATVSAAQFCMDGNFTGGVPACWTNTGGDALNWRTGNPGYAMSGTLDHTAGVASNNFLWVDGSSGATNSTLTSVPIDNADVVAMTSPMLQFYVKSHVTVTAALDNQATDYNEFWGRISYDGGVTFVDKVFINSELGTDWNLFLVEVDKTLLGTNDLIFQFEIAESATTSQAFYNDIALDDVCLIDSTCAGQFTAISTVNGNSDCECNDLAGWTHYGDQTSQELNLSVKKGAYNDPNISPYIVNVQGAATGTSGNLGTLGAGAPYATAQHWYVFNRFWDVEIGTNDASRQPTAATDVRFYYFDADYTSLQSTVATAGFGSAITAHTDMLGWKVANDKDPDPVNNHATVLTADFTSYTNGTVSPTTWAHTPDPEGMMSNQLEYQVTSFSGGGGGFGSGSTNGPLPITLTDFTVTKEGSVSLAAWVTSNEDNNSHFNLQRSLDGNDFATLGKVNSKAVNGTSTVDLSYTFTDESPEIGHNYYRLEQVDLDGQKSYSEVVDLVWGADGSIVAIYPNPASSMLNVDVSIDKVSQLEVRLVDMSGRVVKSVMQKTQKGMNNVTFDLSDIATGVYGVQIYDNNSLIHSTKVNKTDK